MVTRIVRYFAILTLIANYLALVLIMMEIPGFSNEFSVTQIVWGSGIANVLLVVSYYFLRAEFLEKDQKIWVVVGIFVSGISWLFIPFWFTYFGIPFLVIYLGIAIYLLFKPLKITPYLEKL